MVLPLMFVALLWAHASIAVQPAAGAPSARITLESDGWVLVGTFRPADPAVASGAAVLLLHGAARDRRAYAPLAEELASRGVASLRLDLRGEGESTNLGRFEPGQGHELIEGARRDVAVALRWLRGQPGIRPDRVGVLGASYSAEEAAQAARAGAPAAAYVAMSPGNFSDQSIRRVDAAGRPWWFIASTDERFAHTVVARISSESRTARVTFVEGTSHASDILSPHFVLNAEIADWFAARLGGRSAPRLWGGLGPGAFDVGFRRDVTDGAVIDTWYPAAAAAEPPMTFGDYLRLSDDLRGRDPADLSRTAAIAISGAPDGVDAATISALLASPMLARRGSPEVPVRFPVLLWTPRYATTVSQSVLSEFLASHGFVVAFARPVRSDAAKLPFELGGPAAKLEELRARIADMATAVSALERRPTADATRIGLLAWSYTGEMATRFQQREPRVALVAGLSTTLVSDWVYQEKETLQAFDAAALSAVYAVFTEDAARATSQPRLPADRSYVIEMPGLRHGSFNALEGFIPSGLGLSRVQPWSTSGPAGVSGYESLAAMLLRLARHHVRDRAPRALAPLVVRSGLAHEVVVHR